MKSGLNPWLSIWTKPRSTIRNIVDTNPMKGFFYLAALTFLQGFFYFLTTRAIIFPVRFALLILIGVVLSPILGAIWFYFFGWILYFTARWLKGSAPYMHVCAAFAWSRLPLVVDLFMWFVLLIFASNLLMASSVMVNMSIFFIYLISLITSIWAFVIFVNTVREVQKFSICRSIVNIVLAYIIFFIILLIISYILYFLF